jgi:hypothetical protein
MSIMPATAAQVCGLNRRVSVCIFFNASAHPGDIMRTELAFIISNNWTGCVPAL